jgi:hypothetical protein
VLDPKKTTAHKANAITGSSRPLRRHLPMPSPPKIMAPAFHRKRGKFKPSELVEVRVFGTRGKSRWLILRQPGAAILLPCVIPKAV